MKLYVALALTVFVGASACSSGLPRPPYSRQPTAALEPVPFPPPPARVEYVPDQPPGDSVWIDGEWVWGGRAWSWKRGRWVIPIAGATYAPWTTVRSPEGMLYLANGAWRSADGKNVDAPTAISYGKPTVGAVVDSAGDAEHTGRSIKEEKTDDDKKQKKTNASTAASAASADEAPEAAGPPSMHPDGGVN